MSEEVWNYVGKSRKHRGTETPKHQAKVAEEEDTLNRIKSIYTSKVYNGDSNKENKKANKAQEKPKNNGHSNIPVKIKTSKPAVAEKKVQPTPAPRKPESIENSLKNIKVDDLTSYLQSVAANFPDNEMMLLKAAGQFLNERISCIKGEFIFNDKPLSYPTNIIPNDLKKELVELIIHTRDETLLYYFDNCLTSLCEYMNKSFDYMGQFIMIQLIAHKSPQFCISNLARNAMLRNSYQNQSFIGLTLLYALGQGHRDPGVALKVWQDLMIPIVDLKSYTAFIYKYIHNVLSSDTSSRNLKITMMEFTTFFNTLTANKGKKISKEFQRMNDESLVLLIRRYVESASNTTNLFLFLLKTAENFHKPQLLYGGILDCVSSNLDLLKVWKSNYKKYINLSTEVFKYLYQEKDINQWILADSKEFKEFMKDVGALNADLNQKNVMTSENFEESKKILKDKLASND